jgi:hypothetical protein
LGDLRHLCDIARDNGLDPTNSRRLNLPATSFMST